MRPAFFSLVMIFAHVSVAVHCSPRPQRQHQMGKAAGPPAASGRFHSEPNRPMRKDAHRGPLVMSPVRKAPSNLVLVLDWRRKRFLCRDQKGKLYKSRQNDRLDCLLYMWPDVASHHDVLHPPSWLLGLGGQKPSEVSALQETFPSGKRRRRSEEINPSDPLRSEANPPHSAKDADRVQPGSVSRETLTSVDDPLLVLRSNGHGSPVKTNIADRAEQ